MNKIRKGDDVIVIGRQGQGQARHRAARARRPCLVENVNLVKKHVKPNPNKGEQGGIVDKECP
jgi:large subunit ribosomal protein L24